MWYRFSFLDTDETAETIQTDPSKLDEGEVAIDVPSDVIQQAQQFAKDGKARFFRAVDGVRYLFIHGTPDGFFNTGDPTINLGDGIPSNDGYITKEQLPAWVHSQGIDSSIKVIACYGGRMEPVENIKSAFKNKGKIGFYTSVTPEGRNQLVFQKG